MTTDPQWLNDARYLLCARNTTDGDLFRCIEAAANDYEERKQEHERLMRELMEERQRNEHMLATIGDLYRRMRNGETPSS